MSNDPNVNKKLLLTFLGTGKYEPCRYQFSDSLSDEEAFFSVSLAEHLKPDKVVSLQTEKAAEINGTALDGKIKRLGIEHNVVTIPNGASEDELWQIFGLLTEAVDPGCELHLDITHGFRSQPLLGFIALNYLRITRKIRIGGLHYGAFEARKENIAPVFDLTAFLTLLDWTSAAEQYFDTGSAEKLGQLLIDTHQSLRRRGPSDTTSPADLPRTLQNLGASLKAHSNNVRLLRTRDLGASAKKLTNLLEAARNEAETHAKPFLEVVAEVSADFAPLNSSDIGSLCELVVWLAKHGQTTTAITLASELLASYPKIKDGRNIHDERQPEEYQHIHYAKSLIFLLDEEKRPRDSDFEAKAYELANRLRHDFSNEELAALKSADDRIRGLRNDLNHAGFGSTYVNPNALERLADDLERLLNSIPPPGGV